MQRFTKHHVAVFLALLVVATVVANRVAAQAGHSTLASLLIMWSPGLAALAASALTRRPLGAIGWRPWPVRWLALGWALPLLYAFPAYALVWATGLGGVPNPTFLQRARLTLGMPSGPDWLVIVSAFGYITVVNLLPAMVLSLGEEIGWRGYLVPELTERIGLGRAGLWSGVIWGAWHLPGILGGSYGGHGTPRAYQVACFLVMVVSTAMILAWLRMRSGSIWPAAIFHATHNGAIQAFFDRITADTGPTPYFTGEFGAAMIPFVIALAWLCWRAGGTGGRSVGTTGRLQPVLRPEAEAPGGQEAASGNRSAATT
jgi:membrane protease YdiL (CAAX protease family)